MKKGNPITPGLLIVTLPSTAFGHVRSLGGNFRQKPLSIQSKEFGTEI